MKNFIMGTTPDCYNPAYFNLYEQFEYGMYFTESAELVMDYYITDVTEAESVSYGKKEEKKPEPLITKGTAFIDKVKYFFNKILEFIVKLIRMFMDKADELFKINDKFLKEQANMIRTIDNKFWKNIHIDIFDYNMTRLQNTIYAQFNCPKIDEKNNKLKELLSFEGTEEEFKKKYFPDIVRLQQDDKGFKEAAKIYFRNIQGSDSKPTDFSGTAAETKVIRLLEYAINYKQSSAKKIRDSVTGFKGSLERVKADFEKNNISEYIAAESAILTEDNGSVSMDNINGNTLTGEKTGAPHVGTRAFQRVKQYGNLLLALHTAQMTVAEECYFAAIHVLKKVYSLARSQGAINMNKVEKETKKFEEQQETNKRNNEAYNRARRMNGRSDAAQAAANANYKD